MMPDSPPFSAVREEERFNPLKIACDPGEGAPFTLSPALRR